MFVQYSSKKQTKQKDTKHNKKYKGYEFFFIKISDFWNIPFLIFWGLSSDVFRGHLHKGVKGQAVEGTSVMSPEFQKRFQNLLPAQQRVAFWQVPHERAKGERGAGRSAVSGRLLLWHIGAWGCWHVTNVQQLFYAAAKRLVDRQTQKVNGYGAKLIRHWLVCLKS